MAVEYIDAGATIWSPCFKKVKRAADTAAIARGKCKRILTAFDLCDSGLECVLSRISQASIKIAGLLVIVNGNTILYVRKCKYRGTIDRYRDSSMVISSVFSSVYGTGVERPFVLIVAIHRPNVGSRIIVERERPACNDAAVS